MYPYRDDAMISWLVLGGVERLPTFRSMLPILANLGRCPDVIVNLALRQATQQPRHELVGEDDWKGPATIKAAGIQLPHVHAYSQSPEPQMVPGIRSQIIEPFWVLAFGIEHNAAQDGRNESPCPAFSEASYSGHDWNSDLSRRYLEEHHSKEHRGAGFKHD